MSLATTIIGFCFVLKNTDFLFFALCKNLSSNFSPCNSWLSNLNRITGYKKNFFKSYFITATSSFSTVIILPSSTQYCFPPVFMIAYTCAPPSYYTRRIRQLHNKAFTGPVTSGCVTAPCTMT